MAEKLEDDVFGIPVWKSGHSPLEHLKDQDPDKQTAAIDLHEDLCIARSVAVAIYGASWADHVLSVYQLLQQYAAFAFSGTEDDD